jgi:hypothetical protein
VILQKVDYGIFEKSRIMGLEREEKRGKTYENYNGRP